MINTIKNQLNRLFIQIPVLAYTLSNKSLIKGGYTFLRLVYFTLTRKLIRGLQPLSFTFKYEGKTFSLALKDNLDTAVLVEIFVLKEYAWEPTATTVQTVLDLGAHWGDTTLFYALKFPNAEIHAFEPMPEVYQRLCSVTASFENVRSYNFALAQEDGQADFFYSPNSIGNSLIKRTQSEGSITVQTATVDSIRSMCGVEVFDLVKFDIEGAESVLFNYPQLKSLGKSFIGEIHLDLIPESLADIEKIFSDFTVEFHKLKDTRYIITAQLRD